MLQLERLRVTEAANKALSDSLLNAMRNEDIEALKTAILDFQTAGLTNADGPLDEARDALPRLREKEERAKEEKCANLERAIQRNRSSRWGLDFILFCFSRTMSNQIGR